MACSPPAQLMSRAAQFALRLSRAGVAPANARLWSSAAGAPVGISAEEQLVAAVVLERLPIVLPPLPDWELEYRMWSFQHRQQHRKEYPQDFLDMASSARSDEEGDLQFEPAPTITEADRTNNVRSMMRALDKRLYLIVNGQQAQSQSKESRWHFPEKEYADEDTMRQAAEQALAANLGADMDVYFVGNAPCGHLSAADLPSLKRFYFRSQYLGGDITIKNRVLKDYAWVTKEELGNYVDAQQYDFFQKLLV